ncbi:MAG: SRPBCC family protein [Amphiplicatus sp.]
MAKRSVTHATFIIERDYDATPERVFKAFEDTEAKRRWFVEGEGWIIEEYTADFRVGGFERSRFRFKEGPVMTNDTVYQEIAPNERIITAYTMTIDGAPISASLATIEFQKRGNGARLRFTEQGAYLDGHDDIAGREAGTRELFDALDRELKRAG